MTFTTDEQTLTDLDIFAPMGMKSLFFLFNKTKTKGGSDLLEQMFRHPLTDADAINGRCDTLRAFQSMDLMYPLDEHCVHALETYVFDNDGMDRKVLFGGIRSLMMILNELRIFLRKIPDPVPGSGQLSLLSEMHDIIDDPAWQFLFDGLPGGKMSGEELREADRLIRLENIDLVKRLFHCMYTLDVYIAVSCWAASGKWVYAKALSKKEAMINMTNVYHPFLTMPVANSISISRNNIVFITGGNATGKSTFMKATGIAIHLAHMGFPVPAERMDFSVCDGIMTAMELNGDRHSGYSHFYAEIMRVKKMAQHVAAGKSIFFIVDELFRWTNAKDAFETTISILSALIKRGNFFLMMSTHIMETGKALRKQHGHISCLFFPTIMMDGRRVYTYRLVPGIADDKHGMRIIHRAGILTILRNRKAI